MNALNSKDVRWKQRFSNFEKALNQLHEFLAEEKLSKLEAQGLIKAFEYTYELAWNTMKDFYEAQGESSIQGSRDTIRLAFKRGLIEDGEGWMKMVEDRIKTAHTYNQAMADEITTAIIHEHAPQFIQLQQALELKK